MTIYINKLVTEDEDWNFDWTPKGVSADDAIAELVVGDSVPEGLNTHSTSHTQTHTTVWFSGGVAGISYTVPLSVTTTGGRVYAENIEMYIGDR